MGSVNIDPRTDNGIPRAPPAPDGYETALCGERVVLRVERALFWPAQATLFVADVHLGKAATFRAGGVPLPRGGTRRAILPAFGSFTGLAIVKRAPGDRLVALAGTRLFPLPA